MKMKKIGIVVIIVLLVICIVEVVFSFLPIYFVRKAEDSIPYNENNFYIAAYDGAFLECFNDGKITQYEVSVSNGKYAFQKTDSFRLNYPVKKYISWDLFVTEDDSIMFGDIREKEQQKLGTIPHAADASVITDRSGELLYAVVVTSDGLLYVQGDNSTGALGIEAEQVNGEFVQVPYLKNVVKAVCGYNYILVLNSDGEVFLSGTLRKLSYQTFTKLEAPEKIKNIEASDFSETLIALGVNGNVYELGASYFHQDYWLGDIYTTDEIYSTFHQIPKLKNIVFVSSRPEMSAYAIDTNGNAFQWGALWKPMKFTKFTDMKNFFRYIYGLPEYDKIWFRGNFFVLSDNEITAYTW